MEAEKIRYWGVSNLDVADMVELTTLSGWRRRGRRPGAVQPLPARHRVDLLPWCREAGVTLMAYSPSSR